MTRRKRSLRHIRALLAVLAAGLALLVLPATGSAAVTVFGSDLTKPADVVEAFGGDAAFWNAAIGGSASGSVVPADGQITLASVKGSVLADPTGRAKPDPQFHFQVLRPQPDGSVKVDLSSGAFRLPVGGDTQKISNFQPVNLCVHKGDYVDFNDIGGFEWRWGNYQGMPVQAFSRTPGSAVSLYSRSNGTNVGSQWKPQATNPGEELLMRTTLASGPDATDICPGGFAQHVFQGLSVSSGQTVALRTRTRTAKIRVLCPGATYGSCKGLMSLDTTFGNRDTGLGNISFDVPRGYPLNLVVKLSSAGVKLAQRARTLVANVNVSSHDDPKAGRAKPGIPVQSKITTANIRIKPDRLAVKKKKKKH